MPRLHYINYKVTDGSPRARMLDELCDRLGLDHSHKSRVRAIDAAIAIALLAEIQGRIELNID